jgi:hypothetical protein
MAQDTNWTAGLECREAALRRHYASGVVLNYTSGSLVPPLHALRGRTTTAAFVDAESRPLDGSRVYRFHLPPGVPARTFWSVVVYDTQTRSMLQTDQQFPSTGSQNPAVRTNTDGSYDVYFGPTAPAAHEPNWVQTRSDKLWWVILRPYEPEASWFGKSWRPGEWTLVS